MKISDVRGRQLKIDTINPTDYYAVFFRVFQIDQFSKTRTMTLLSRLFCPSLDIPTDLIRRTRSFAVLWTVLKPCDAENIIGKIRIGLLDIHYE